MDDITLRQAQTMVDQWIKTYGVRYFSELTNMTVLTEEVGEMARIMARKYGDQSFKKGEKSDLGDEMADVLWVLLCIANQTGVDLTAELQRNITKKTARDSQRHINNNKLINEKMTEEHSHNHEHHHHGEAPKMSKYDEALSKYNTNVNDDDVRKAVRALIAEKVHENDTMEVKKFLMGSVELTSLKTTDSDESILALTEQVNRFDEAYPDLPHVATICVYPCFAQTVAEALEIDGVEIACVSGNFPSSQALTEVKVAETALAIKDGATEIDIVMPVGKFLNGDYESVADEISELKAVCGEKKMKVILETGCLKTASNIKKAAIIAIYAGADYIKTSTGKLEPAATPEAAYVMCQAIKEYYDLTGIQIGFKPAGGLNSVMDALIYYTIVKEVLGKQWLTNEWFRLGTSRLENMLLSEVTGKETKFF